MEEEKKLPEPDLYEQEEKCQKAMRVVARAMLMRLVMAALMVWVVICNPGQAITWGLLVFVMIILVSGMIPLWKEWRKQKTLLKALIAQEEN